MLVVRRLLSQAVLSKSTPSAGFPVLATPARSNCASTANGLARLTNRGYSTSMVEELAAETVRFVLSGGMSPDRKGVPRERTCVYRPGVGGPDV